MDMSKMIFITGFARGGTSWLRDCVAFHPDVKKIPKEMVAFGENNNAESIQSSIAEAIEENSLGDSPFYVNKAPANAPHIFKGCELFPESKFVFIIRDPRDVLVSHKRGFQKWMGGKNSTVDGCMGKIKKYFEGYKSSAKFENMLLVRYEDLHQNFHQVIGEIYEFLGLYFDKKLLNECYQNNNFTAKSGRNNVEDRNAAARKGVIGDWRNFLDKKELNWFKKNDYFKVFMDSYGYRWNDITYRSILEAMVDGGVKSIALDNLLNLKLNQKSPNLLLLHDVDLLTTKEARDGVREIAKMENDLGLDAVFNFLPLDDSRYGKLSPSQVIDIIHEVKELHPQAEIGLHVNATERFFPAKREEVFGIEHPDIARSLKYLDEQIEAYAKEGIEFRFGTAHGYGRRKKEPNNASELVRTRLLKHGIRLYDDDLRPSIQNLASHEARLHDVGGALTVKRFPSAGQVDVAETYKAFKPASLINFLIHPGNYDIHRPLLLGTRVNNIRK